jgi:hypothetical protein
MARDSIVLTDSQQLEFSRIAQSRSLPLDMSSAPG